MRRYPPKEEAVEVRKGGVKIRREVVDLIVEEGIDDLLVGVE